MFNYLARALAARIMEREPDEIIGYMYLDRWHIIPRNRFFNLYLHMFNGDDGPIPHDHPWASLSYMVAGKVLEIRPGLGSDYIAAGQFKYRSAAYMHRLELYRDRGGLARPAITFFATGPRQRRWGFQFPDGWRYWRDVDTNERSKS